MKVSIMAPGIGIGAPSEISSNLEHSITQSVARDVNFFGKCRMQGMFINSKEQVTFVRSSTCIGTLPMGIFWDL